MAVTYVKDFTFPPSFGFREPVKGFAKGGSVKPSSFKHGGEVKRKAAGGKNWIAGAIKHPGALRSALHAKKGEPIPAKKLEKATHSKNETLARRARMAETLKGMHHKDGGKVEHRAKGGHVAGCKCAMCSGGKVSMAKGGKVHSDEAEDKVLIRKMVKKEDLKSPTKKAAGGLSRAISPKKNAAIHAKARVRKPTPKMGMGVPKMGALAGLGAPPAAPHMGMAPPGMAPGMGTPPGMPMGGPRPMPGGPPMMGGMADGGSVRHVYVHHISGKRK